jgi:benzylsuccinate CoA-transferase BbsF subunit
MKMARPVFEGVRILELGSGAAGPVATRMFAELGATVVRVESARRPDFLRLLPFPKLDARRPDGGPDLDLAPMFAALNPGKWSVALDLSRAEGRALAKRLTGWADVVAENFSPGVMERFGLDYESLRAAKPDLIVVSGCLFGQTGPQRHYPGFGGQGSAIAGFNHLTGWPDREGVGPYATITDSLSPRYVALLVAGALRERRRTGRGRHIDLSQIEAGIYSLSEPGLRYAATGERMARRGNRDEVAVPHGVYPCRGEERWIAIAVFGDEEWRALAGAMGDPAWAREAPFESASGRRTFEDDLDARIAAWTRGHEALELAERLQGAGVRAGPVLAPGELLSDPQLAARGHFVTLEQPRLGPLAFERSGFRLAESPGGVRAPAPRLGEHSHDVLCGILGVGASEYERLVSEGVVA